MSATFNVYRREVGDTNPPVAIATGLTSKEYSDATAIEGKSYLYSVGAIFNSVEKISDELLVRATSNASGLLASLFDASEKGFAYNFQDLSTLWQDVTGTIPVTAVDQSIARIDDISGNGNHLIQADAAKRPQIKQDAEGFYAWFDGSKFMYSANVIVFDSVNIYTLMCRLTSATMIGVIVEASEDFNSHVATFMLINDAKKISLASHGSQYNSATVDLDDDYFAVCAMNTTLPTKITMMRVNGVEKQKTGVMNDSTWGVLDRKIYVGARAGTSLFLTSKVRMLSFVGRMLTTQEITDVESVLMP